MPDKILKNMMEALVDQNIDNGLSNYDICKCDRCKMDIKAYALNYLPPRYVATNLGSLYAKVDAISYQYEVDVLAAIIKGIEVVKQNPRHDIK